jgi:hypothetical protein
VKLVFGGVLALIVMIALAFVLELGGLKWKSYFAPKHEAVRREVFKETRSFNEAKLQELTKYRLEYIRATDDIEKKALESTIRHQFADYDTQKLPYELEVFLKDVLY